jgi:hypothetical protein
MMELMVMGFMNFKSNESMMRKHKGNFEIVVGELAALM